MNSLWRSLAACFVLLWSVLGFSLEKLSVTVDVKAPQFTISLPANPTTGFKWVVKDYDTTHFNYLNSEYVAGLPARIGSGGHTIFSFAPKPKVKYPKSSLMTFCYARPWDVKSGTETEVSISFVSKK